MRSKDYKNFEDSFTQLQPNEMIRVALVEGIKGKYVSENTERQRYRRLLKQYLDIKEEQIDLLFRLYGDFHNPNYGFTGKQKKTLDGLLQKVSYKSKKWKDFDYDHLRKEKVVIDFEGDKQGLVQKMQEIDERRVVFAKERIYEPEKKKNEKR